MSEKQPVSPNRSSGPSKGLVDTIATGWAPRPGPPEEPLPSVAFAAARREVVSAAFPGERLVVPAGGFKIRSNDCDYRFRPHSAFVHLTGLGADREPDAVLVLEPRPDDDGHDPVLYFKPRAERDDEEFWRNARYGEFWVGVRPSLGEVEIELGLTCRHIDDLADALAKDAGTVVTRVVPSVDDDVTDLVHTAGGASTDGDSTFAEFLSELRLIKDAYEVEQLELSCRSTAEGFAEVVKALPTAVARGRGERWVEGVFELVARHRGNGVGYDTIAAAGPNACTLHWIRNDGEVRPGELLLLDAGVEADSLYTADVTRTVPVDGRFTPVQRRVYGAVIAAQAAGFAAVKPGNLFSDVHAAASRVIAEKLAELGVLPVTPAESLAPDGGQHRRWMVHGTSHHLGLDVHDCALARQETYHGAVLRPGMVLTVEPGLYFKADDLTVPAELRGIGIRIEDDVLVTEDGYRILSDDVPRDPDMVELWMASLDD